MNFANRVAFIFSNKPEALPATHEAFSRSADAEHRLTDRRAKIPMSSRRHCDAWVLAAAVAWRKSAALISGSNNFAPSHAVQTNDLSSNPSSSCAPSDRSEGVCFRAVRSSSTNIKMTTNEQQQQQSQPDATPQGDEQAADQQEPKSGEAVDEEQKSVDQDQENETSLKPANGQAAAATAPNQEQKEEIKASEGSFIPEAPSEHLEALRKFSVVSFREVCELYEIDLEKGERDRQVIRRRPPVYQSVRYYIMLLVLVSPFVTTYSRTIINFAITDMIDPRFTQRQAEIKQPTGLSPNATKLLAFDMDNSCPIDEPTRERLIEEDSKDTERAQTTQGEKFEWDTVSQGLLKGAYSYGHAFFQIPGSRLSEIYGSRLIIGTNALLIGLCCLAAPLLASLHFNLIFVDLMLLGILGSFMTPAAITLISNWLTPGEKTLMMSFILVGSRLGYALSAYLCGQLLQAGISWRYVFYSSGELQFLPSISPQLRAA